MNARSRPQQGAASDLAGGGINTDSTALPELSEWAVRRNAVVAWLPHATREAVEAFALRHFDRAESAEFCIGEEHRRADCAAQRQASWAIADALDWTAQSSRPSHFELVQRRSEVAS
jgi:hypothetical protein